MWKQCEEAEQEAAAARQRKNAAKRVRNQKPGGMSQAEGASFVQTQMQIALSKAHTAELVQITAYLANHLLNASAALENPEQSELLSATLQHCQCLQAEFRRR